MKLRNFKPSNTLKVGLSVTWKCIHYHYISTEQDSTAFFDDLLLAAILSEINKRQEEFVEILSEYFEVKTIDDALNLECSDILKTLQGRPCFYAYGSKGDNIGFDSYGKNELNFGNFVYNGDFRETKLVKFEEEVSYADVAIGILKIVL